MTISDAFMWCRLYVAQAGDGPTLVAQNDEYRIRAGELCKAAVLNGTYNVTDAKVRKALGYKAPPDDALL